MASIGILALQGAVSEHAFHVQRAGHTPVFVRTAEHLDTADALIIPGGESTAIYHLMKKNGMDAAVRQFAAQRKPILGTCAGLVLLAREIDGQTGTSLGLMDLSIRRNASGRQTDSFEQIIDVKGLDRPVRAVFIRAPYILSAGPGVEALAETDGHTVAARQNNCLVCSFHPELTEDAAFLQLFFEMAVQDRENRDIQAFRQ